MRSAVDRLINRLHPRRPLRRSLTRHLAAGLSVTFGALSALAFQALPSDGATARSLVLLGFAGNDALYNYDFLSTSASATNVDWTANMMFRNNAEIDKVESILMPEFRNEGSVKYALLKDTSYVWDSDRGMKNPAGTCPSDVHLRLYADGDDRMYNLTDGFYIFGTTHIDWYEGCSGEQFGWSEDAESAFVNRFRNKGYVVWEDCCDWFDGSTRLSGDRRPGSRVAAQLRRARSVTAPVLSSANVGKEGIEAADGAGGIPPSVPLLPTPTRRASLTGSPSVTKATTSGTITV